MIVTQCVNPPVPTRQWDWVAYIEGGKTPNVLLTGAVRRPVE